MSPTVKNWLYLCIGLVCAAIFMFGIAPWVMNSSETLRHHQESVQKNDLHAGVYFYTQVEASGVGSQTIQRSLQHSATPITPQKDTPQP